MEMSGSYPGIRDEALRMLAQDLVILRASGMRRQAFECPSTLASVASVM